MLPDFIRHLGNWLENVQELHYSMKIGWEALRVAAGFPKEQGSYVIHRSKVKPSKQLVDMVFPNIAVSKKEFEDLPLQEQMERKTAKNVLEVLDYLAEVFLQDSCAILLMEAKDGQDPRRESPFFQIPFFVENPLFDEFFCKYQEEIVVHEDPHNDPTIDAIKNAAPLIGNHLAGLHAEQRRQNQVMMQFRQELNSICGSQGESMHSLATNVEQMVRHIGHEQWMKDRAAEAQLNSPFRLGRTLGGDQYGNALTPESPEDTHDAHEAHDTPLEHRQEGDSLLNDNAGINSDEAQDDGDTPIPDLVTNFKTLQSMYDVWNGTDGTPCDSHGGLKTVWKDANYRKGKPESAKKAVRRLQYVNKYFDYMLDKGESIVAIFERIEDAFSTTNKTEITLSGTETVLRKKIKWNRKNIE